MVIKGKYGERKVIVFVIFYLRKVFCIIFRNYINILIVFWEVEIFVFVNLLKKRG